MTTRCINSLNDLDKISSRIYRKHSSSRFRASVEARLKSAKKKTEKRLQELENQNRTISLNPINSKTSKPSQMNSDAVIDKCSESNQDKDGSSSKSSKRMCSKLLNHNKNNSNMNGRRFSVKTVPETTKVVKLSKSTDLHQRSVSVYGKHTQSIDSIDPSCSWFNFKPGLSTGKIDTFACEALNKKPLCYTVSMKETKSIPKLLEHQTEVRIGTNGVVKLDVNAKNKKKNYKNKTVKKKLRTAPLSWDEQLNWNDVQIRTPRSSDESNVDEKVASETQPVIFNEPLKPGVNHSTQDITSARSPAFHFKRPPHQATLSLDSRNITDSEKCEEGTYIWVYDPQFPGEAEDLVAVSKDGNALLLFREYESEDIEKMDLPVFDISSMNSLVSNDKPVGDKQNNCFLQRRPIPEKLVDGSRTKFDYSHRKVDFDNSFKERRPKSGIQRVKPDVQRYVFKGDESRRRRPFSAPLTTPDWMRDKSDIASLDKLLASVKQKQVIQIPTSENESRSSTNTPEGSQTPVVKKSNLKKIEDKKLTKTSRNSGSARVTFAANSAPLQRFQEPTHSMIRSSSQQSAALPTSPSVLCLDVPDEIPKNLPPAQALIDLRKQIRDDLAQQNKALELDIQQLYLRKPRT